MLTLNKPEEKRKKKTVKIICQTVPSLNEDIDTEKKRGTYDLE